MAWYAELKRRKWYCINGFNAIKSYRKFLYDNWYSSLSEEEKIKLEKLKKKKEERNNIELQNAVTRLMAMTSIVNGMRYNLEKKRIQEKYNGIYDEFGFSKL